VTVFEPIAACCNCSLMDSVFEKLNVCLIEVLILAHKDQCFIPEFLVLMLVGIFKFLYDWDFSGTEKELKQALKLSPNYAQTNHWHAIYVAHMRRFEEAIAEATRARELDPLSPLINQTMGNVLMLAGDYDGAVDALLHTLELDLHFAAAHSVLACVYCLKGMYEESLARF